MPAMINLDYADVKTIMSKKGPAMIGFGLGSGPKKAQEAAARAISSPLLEHSISGSNSAIVSIVGGSSSTLYDFNDVVDYIRNAAGNDINIIFGASINDSLEDSIQVTVIATDFAIGENEVKAASFNPNFERKPLVNETHGIDLTDNQLNIDSDTTEFVPTFFNKKN